MGRQIERRGLLLIPDALELGNLTKEMGGKVARRLDMYYLDEKELAEFYQPLLMEGVVADNGYGVEAGAEKVIFETHEIPFCPEGYDDNPRVVVAGSLHRAEGKPFTADYIHSAWRREAILGKDDDVLCVVNFCADGATPFVSRDFWVKEVEALSTFQHEGKEFVNPDMLWRVILSALINREKDVYMPAEMAKIWEIASKHCVIDKIFDKFELPLIRSRLMGRTDSMTKIAFKERGWYFDANRLSREVIITVMQAFGRVYERLFPNYDYQEPGIFPYGLLGVQIAAVPLNSELVETLSVEKSPGTQLFGGATTGDVSFSRSDGRLFELLNDPGIVDSHDRRQALIGEFVKTGSIQEIIQRTELQNISEKTLWQYTELIFALARNASLGCGPTFKQFESEFKKAIVVPTGKPTCVFSPWTEMLHTDGARDRNEAVAKTLLMHGEGDHVSLGLALYPFLQLLFSRVQYLSGGLEFFGRGDDLAWVGMSVHSDCGERAAMLNDKHLTLPQMRRWRNAPTP